MVQHEEVIDSEGDEAVAFGDLFQHVSRHRLHDVDAGDGGHFLLRAADCGERFDHFRMRELPRNAERRGQVVRPDEVAIHARHAQDRVDVLHGVDVLYLHEDDALLVQPAVVLLEFIRVALRPRQAHAARADRRIFHRRHDRRRLLGGVHGRGDDAVRASVHHALDDVRIVTAHAHHRGDPREVDGADQLRRAFEGDGAVLEIDGEPVEARAHEQLGDRRVRNRDPRSEGASVQEFAFSGAAQFHGAVRFGSQRFRSPQAPHRVSSRFPRPPRARDAARWTPARWPRARPAGARWR